MMLFKSADTLQKFLREQKNKGKNIGFIPTMGALHQGHISLINRAKKQGDFTVCSIFVNPTQFNDPKDFQLYPVTIETDIYQLEATGCEVLFLPSVDEIYPDGIQQTIQYDLGYLETVLEGAFRPGHFQGVCQVVDRLLQIVEPDHLYMGQKDYQQCMVINRLLELRGSNNAIELVIGPTLREADGLAMSSRNMRLNAEERQKATTIYNTLQFIKTNIQPGNTEKITRHARAMLSENGFKTDYAAIADANTLQLIDEWDGKQKVVALIAAFLNNVRLIDNMILN